MCDLCIKSVVIEDTKNPLLSWQIIVYALRISLSFQAKYLYFMLLCPLEASYPISSLMESSVSFS